MSTTISSSTTGPVVLGTADNPLYITSTGTVTSTGSADGIDGGAGTTWTITNAGVVSAISGNGVSLASSGTIGNTGSISGNDALVLRAGGSVTNNVGGSISGLGPLGAGLGSGAGVYITGAAGTVTNQGTISGVAYGIGLGHGGLVTNTSGITGGEDGVIVLGAVGTVANSGNITATVDDGVALFAGGSVTNASGASISGLGTLGAGVFITGGVGTVTNAGSISGPNHHGVLIAAGGSLSNAATGFISALGAGVFFENQAGTLTNAGQISGAGTDGTGIYLENGGSATNTSTGIITGHKFGAFLEGGFTTLANYGSISGATYDGVVLGLGGLVTNAAGASISGASGGVYVKYRAAGTVTNSGNISATGTGSAGIDLADGGSVTNNSTGSVSGNSFGVFVTGAGGTVANSGSIASAKYGAIELAKGGSVTNSAGASIMGGSIGVYVGTGGAGTVTNSGSISAASATGAGVDFAGGGSITNNSGGSISGSAFGVFTNGVPATLSNSGSISGSHGVGLEAGGSVTNAASASIAGQASGVFAQGGAATLSNAGSISASAGAGADIEGGGSVTNLAGASISGATFGVFLTGGSGTVTNAGTISGGTYAVDFAGSATNRLVVDPGAVFIGKVIGGGGTLELGTGTGSIGGVGTGSFNNFQVVAVDVGASWTLNGANIAPTVLDNGTLSIAGSLDVSTAIDASSTGLFQLGSGATFEVAAATGTTTKINFLDSSSELIIDNAASFGINVGTASYAGPQLQHFVTGDKIDLKGFSSVGATLSYNASTGVLQVSNSASQVASLDFQTSSLSPGTTFAATSDGATGIFVTDTSPVITVIEALGSTELVQAGSNFFLDTISGGTGPELKYGGSPVVAGEFGSWTPIAGEITGSGYEVAWKLPGADQYSIWNTDSNGNEIFSTGAISGSAVDAYETSFHQDLNGDGTIGPTVMTSLVRVGSNFFLDAISSGTGPELKYGGAPVVSGQFGSWTPIAGEITGNGYEVAWKLTGADQYSIWNTDNNGNEISSTGAISGIAVETYEASFQRDINGDGTIGPIVTVIEASGSTELVQAGGNFLLDAVTSGSGPELKYGGSPVVAGEFGSWTPIAAEITGGGYEVAWKLTGADQYSIWNTDNNGNEISSTGAISGIAVETYEASFQRDINGDGTIGPIVTVIEAFGSTELVQAGGNFLLDAVTSGSGPELKYGGSPVVAGEFGSWTPIAAEITGSGYEVAWKLPGNDQYSIWNTDSGGNEFSNTGAISGSSNTLISLEASFHQDLNGDGVVFTSGSGSVVGAGSLLIGAGASAELTGAYSGTISFAAASGTLTIDHSVNFSGNIAGQLATGDVIDLADITAGAGATIAYSGNNSPGTLTVSDGTHTASIALLGNYSLANFTASSDGHGGTSVVDPPLPQGGSGCSDSGNGSAVHPITISDFGWLDPAPPAGPPPSPYAKLAGLLDQYMAAGSPQDAASLCKSSWAAPQQALLGDKDFLTRPQS